MTKHKTSNASAATENTSRAGIDPALLEALRAFVAEGRGRAILLDGAWGTGKTSFVKQVVIPIGDANSRAVHYLSLYNLTDLASIESALATLQLGAPDNKALAGSIGTILGGLLQSAGDASKGNAGAIGTMAGVFHDIVRSKALRAIGANHLVIFDDIERYRGHPVDVLAVANQLAEHQGATVILVGYERELAKIAGETLFDAYRLQKEKAVAQTFEFSRSVEGCIELLLANRARSSGEFARWLSTYRNTIIDVCRKLGCCNLRIIDGAIDALLTIFRRHGSELEKYARDAERLVTECFAIAIALRDHRNKAAISVHDMTHLIHRYRDTMGRAQEMVQHPDKVFGGDFQVESPAAVLNFASAVLHSDGISHRSLERLLVAGLLDEKLLGEEIERWNPLGQTPFDTLTSYQRLDDWSLLDESVAAVLEALRSGGKPPAKAQTLRAIFIVLAQWQNETVIDMSRDDLGALLESYCEHLKTVEPAPFTEPDDTLAELLAQHALEQEYDDEASRPMPVEEILYGLYLRLKSREADNRTQLLHELFARDKEGFLDALETKWAGVEILHHFDKEMLSGWIEDASPHHLRRLSGMLWYRIADWGAAYEEGYFYEALRETCEELLNRSRSPGRRFWYRQLRRNALSVLEKPNIVYRNGYKDSESHSADTPDE